MEIEITNEQETDVTLSPTTLAGHPVDIQNPEWSVISGDSTVTPDPSNPLKATLRSADTPGDTQVLVKGDADLGEGVVEVSDVIRLTVVGAMAANLGLAQGEVRLKT